MAGLSLEALRYRGSGWWIDRMLPASPLGLLAVAVLLPVAWVATGYAITDDRDAFLATPDIVHQLWFFPLHILSVRLVGRLWGDDLQPALDGLAFDARTDRRVRLGAFGRNASLGALLMASYFIYRDCSFGLTASDAGLTPFDDPDLWDFSALGHQVHVMMLALWVVEWLFYGHLLWLQIWVLVSWQHELSRKDFSPDLDKVLGDSGYKAAFSLFSRTATVCLVFALGNLVFIYLTGELFPRDAVEIDSVGDFLREMSDLLSVAVLFLFAVAAVLAFVVALRKQIHKAVRKLLAHAGGIALAELAQPLVLTGESNRDVERLRARVDAQGGVIRAVALQREADLVGGRAVVAIALKAAIPLITTAIKIKKMFG